MPNIAQRLGSLKGRKISQKFRANGKLLLTGEYFVLDGAKALAIPVRFGQVMHVKESPGSEIIWSSHDHTGETWFSAKFDLLDFKATRTTDPAISDPLTQIFKAACNLNSDFLSKWKKYRVDTYLEFDRQWGLGSSSTLIACMADWADVNPYLLLFNTLGGSGYDVACANAEGPVLYQLGEEELHISHVDFDPPFKTNLYIIYLGQKQDSGEARKHYYKHRSQSNGALQKISELSERILEIETLSGFESALNEHEAIISKSLNLPTVKSTRFADYWGTVKSLGAWGGDFVLATSSATPEETRAYFEAKGHSTVFRFAEMLLSTPDPVKPLVS
ncbi:MAG: GYDIA family GHMP kinase [Saprospiraceae bacterium]|nr:GYDIA family GHMP kinase [Saprospiraceae bacterium]